MVVSCIFSVAAADYSFPPDTLPRRLQTMRFALWQSVRLLAACFLLTLCATSILAQTHVVSQADVHKELVNAARTRQQNLQKVRGLFASDETRKAMESAQISPEKVDAAISTLSDDELARMAYRADRLDEDFAAGRISNRDLLIIILGIAAIILIIVAVR
jgi:Flp pilus assembly protein TadB